MSMDHKHNDLEGNPLSDLLSFGLFRLDLTAKQLWREERRLNLRPQACAVLGYLVQRPGQIISKEELLQQIWRGEAVTPSALRICIHQIRSALRETGDAPRYIETGANGGISLSRPS